MKKCLIENCPNDARKRSPVCSSCAHCFYYWEHHERGVVAIIDRQQQLAKWQDRMVFLGSKTRRFRRAKRVIEKARS